MIRIGDFARLSQVTITTLRHYDELGLLAPASVDPATGYRYYSVSQLPRLNRILSLRDLGFSLEQIGEALAEGVNLEQLRGMLKLRRAEVEQRLAEDGERLARIEARLRQIEEENTVPDYEVVLKKVPPFLVASRRISIPSNDQVPQYLDRAYREVFAHLQAVGARQSGAHLSLWHTTAETLADEDAEAVVPIDRGGPSGETVRVYELPETQVASVVHHGDFSQFQRGHAALLSWIEAHGYSIVGPFREIYLEHDQDDLGNSTTEIQYPVAKP
jgi:DNA-binding transcriptional MerR regulator